MADELATPDQRQQKMKEFMSLLPLTIEIAGMPTSGLNELLTSANMEARVICLKNAYKLARQMIRELGDATT